MGLVGCLHNSSWEELSDNEWHHVTITVNNVNRSTTASTRIKRLYLDGELFEEKEFSIRIDYNQSDITSRDPFVLGGIHSGSDPLVGKIDELRLYSTELTTEEVDDIFRNQ